MTACTQSRYCCVLFELLGAPVLFNMYSVENSFAAISLSQNIAVCPLLPQNKDTLSHPEDTAICSRSVTPSSPRGVEVGLSHHSVPLCWLGGRWDSAIIRSRLENLWDSAIVQSRLENLPVLTRLGPVLAGVSLGSGFCTGSYLGERFEISDILQHTPAATAIRVELWRLSYAAGHGSSFGCVLVRSSSSS